MFLLRSNARVAGLLHTTTATIAGGLRQFGLSLPRQHRFFDSRVKLTRDTRSFKRGALYFFLPIRRRLLKLEKPLMTMVHMKALVSVVYLGLVQLGSLGQQLLLAILKVRRWWQATRLITVRAFALTASNWAHMPTQATTHRIRGCAFLPKRLCPAELLRGRRTVFVDTSHKIRHNGELTGAL